MKLYFLRLTATLTFALLCICAAGSKPTDTRHIEVIAKKYSFEPNEITIKKGESVTLAVHSEDATHGLVISSLGVRTEIKKGETQDLTLTPTTIGTFEGKCAHFCGMGHGSMKFQVHVVE